VKAIIIIIIIIIIINLNCIHERNMNRLNSENAC